MKYKVMLNSWGGTQHEYASGLTYRDAERMCEDMHWVLDEGGYIWDLTIEEE